MRERKIIQLQDGLNTASRTSDTRHSINKRHKEKLLQIPTNTKYATHITDNKRLQNEHMKKIRSYLHSNDTTRCNERAN